MEMVQLLHPETSTVGSSKLRSKSKDSSQKLNNKVRQLKYHAGYVCVKGDNMLLPSYNVHIWLMPGSKSKQVHIVPNRMMFVYFIIHFHSTKVNQS